MAVPSSGVELRRTVINFAPTDEERHYGGLNGSHGMAVMTKEQKCKDMLLFVFWPAFWVN